MVRFSIFGLESLDRIPNHRNAPAALEQTLGRETNAVFRHHAKHDKFDIRTQSLNQFVCVTAFEDVERLLLQQNLLVARKIRPATLAAGLRWGR